MIVGTAKASFLLCHAVVTAFFLNGCRYHVDSSLSPEPDPKTGSASDFHISPELLKENWSNITFQDRYVWGRSYFVNWWARPVYKFFSWNGFLPAHSWDNCHSYVMLKDTQGTWYRFEIWPDENDTSKDDKQKERLKPFVTKCTSESSCHPASRSSTIKFEDLRQATDFPTNLSDLSDSEFQARKATICAEEYNFRFTSDVPEIEHRSRPFRVVDVNLRQQTAEIKFSNLIDNVRWPRGGKVDHPFTLENIMDWIKKEYTDYTYGHLFNNCHNFVNGFLDQFKLTSSELLEKDHDANTNQQTANNSNNSSSRVG